jgi:hypothetical protein
MGGAGGAPSCMPVILAQNHPGGMHLSIYQNQGGSIVFVGAMSFFNNGISWIGGAHAGPLASTDTPGSANGPTVGVTNQETWPKSLFYCTGFIQAEEAFIVGGNNGAVYGITGSIFDTAHNKLADVVGGIITKIYNTA